jgi:hypothetical protein
MQVEGKSNVGTRVIFRNCRAWANPNPNGPRIAPWPVETVYQENSDDEALLNCTGNHFPVVSTAKNARGVRMRMPS